MWRRRRRTRLLFRSQSGCCSCERPASPCRPLPETRRLPALCRGGLPPTPIPTLTPPSRPTALLAAVPSLHMASSAQSGGTSGGPAVPTVQRGIVKMVRAGPETLTPSPASGRVLAPAPLPLPRVCMVSQIPFPLSLSLLFTHSRNSLPRRNPTRNPLGTLLPGHPGIKGHGDFRGRGTQICCLPGQIGYLID